MASAKQIALSKQLRRRAQSNLERLRVEAKAALDAARDNREREIRDRVASKIAGAREVIAEALWDIAEDNGEPEHYSWQYVTERADRGDYLAIADTYRAQADVVIARLIGPTLPNLGKDDS